MSNCRYQAFSPSLETSSFNTKNVDILIKHGSDADKKRYNFVFQAMNGFKKT